MKKLSKDSRQVASIHQTSDNPTAVVTIIDPVDGGKRKWSSSYRFCCEELLSRICTDMLAFCEGVNVFGGRCNSRKPGFRLTQFSETQKVRRSRVRRPR